MAILEELPIPGQYSGILEQIRATLAHLPPAEQRVGERILADPGQTIAMSISEFAVLCGVAQPTVSKFCRSIGVSGYAALRLRLSHDFATQSPAKSSNIAPAEIMMELIKQFSSLVDLPIIAHNLLIAAHVEIWSTPAFASAGEQLADRLMARGIRAANATFPPRWGERAAGLKSDALIVLLASSLDDALLVALRRARQRGARLLCCAIEVPRHFTQQLDWLISLPAAFAPELVGLALVEILITAVQEASELPGPSGPASPWQDWPHTRSVFLPTSGDPIPAMLLMREDPPQQRPLVLYFGGYTNAKETFVPGLRNRDNLVCPRIIATLLNAGYHVLALDAQAHGARKRAWEDTNTLIYESLRGKGNDVLTAARLEIPYLVEGVRHLGLPGDIIPIGVVGQSWGGLQSLYTLAGDTRIVCGVALMPVINIRLIVHPPEKKDYSTLEGAPRVVVGEPGAWMGSLLAPRPLLLICGEKDNLAPMRYLQSFFESLRPAYAARDANEHLRYKVLPDVAHTYNRQMIEAMLDWLTRYLPVPAIDEGVQGIAEAGAENERT